MNRSEVGIARAQGLKLREIGAMLGVSHQRVDQLLRPEKAAARVAVAKALREGVIFRPTTCEDCGIFCKPDGHHPNYSEPLTVRWLCKKCHGKAFVKRKRKSVHYSLADLISEVEIPCPDCSLDIETVVDGKKMRAARYAAGLALHEVAPRMGVSIMTLSRLERSNKTTEDQALKFISAISGG